MKHFEQRLTPVDLVILMLLIQLALIDLAKAIGFIP